MTKFFRKKPVRIENRLNHACAMFVSFAIIDPTIEQDQFGSSTDFKKSFLTGKSFQEFYILIYEWFANKYGAAFTTRREWILTATLIASGTALRMNVPVLYFRKIDSVTANMKFPIRLEDDEVVVDWIVDPPRWSNLPESERESAHREASQTAASVRLIKSKLLIPERPDDLSISFSTDIVVHIQTAAVHIIEGRSYGLSCWEIHQSCEKILKLILRQSGISYPNTHELNELIKRLPDDQQNTFLHECKLQMPTSREVVTYRYSGNKILDLFEAYKFYKSGIEFILACIPHVKLSYELAGKMLTMRKPDFIP